MWGRSIPGSGKYAPDSDGPSAPASSGWAGAIRPLSLFGQRAPPEGSPMQENGGGRSPAGQERGGRSSKAAGDKGPNVCEETVPGVNNELSSTSQRRGGEGRGGAGGKAKPPPTAKTLTPLGRLALESGDGLSFPPSSKIDRPDEEKAKETTPNPIPSTPAKASSSQEVLGGTGASPDDGKSRPGASQTNAFLTASVVNGVPRKDEAGRVYHVYIIHCTFGEIEWCFPPLFPARSPRGAHPSPAAQVGRERLQRLCCPRRLVAGPDQQQVPVRLSSPPAPPQARDAAPHGTPPPPSSTESAPPAIPPPPPPCSPAAPC